MAKAGEFPQFAQEERGREHLEAAQAHDRFERRPEPPLAGQRLNLRADAHHAFARRAHALEILLQHHLVRRVRQHQFAQIAFVRRVPTRLAAILVTQPQEQRLELLPAAPQVVDGVGPRPAQITQRLVRGLGHVDRRQLARAMVAGQLDRVRRSFFIRSPLFLGMSEGAITWQSIPSCRKRRAMPKPHGPAS